MKYLFILFAALLMLGCIEAQQANGPEPFRDTQLDCVLAISADFSGSFSDLMDERAHDLLFDLMSQFMSDEIGSESRIVLGQISAGGDTVIFEGSPADLKRKFSKPEKLKQFLQEQADPAGSRVYQSTEELVKHVCNMHGVTKKTRVLTVLLSDCKDDESEHEQWRNKGHQMMTALESYQELGGCLAIYFCARSEIPRWKQIMSACGFEKSRFIIEAEIAESPRLPEFY